MNPAPNAQALCWQAFIDYVGQPGTFPCTTMREGRPPSPSWLGRRRVRLFCVGGPEGSRRGCERHGKSYLTRRRRGEEGDGGGSLTGGAIPSA